MSSLISLTNYFKAHIHSGLQLPHILNEALDKTFSAEVAQCVKCSKSSEVMVTAEISGLPWISSDSMLKLFKPFKPNYLIFEM